MLCILIYFLFEIYSYEIKITVYFGQLVAILSESINDQLVAIF